MEARANEIVGAGTLALVLAGLLTGCSKSSPTAPSAPAAPVVARLEIVGPDTVAPGERAQFAVIGHLTDGSQNDVTNQSTWGDAQPYLSSAGNGVFIGLQQGEPRIQATYVAGNRNVWAYKDIIVVPSGTYRLAGKVLELDSPESPVPDARLEVLTGAATRLQAVTDWEGGYRLYGVAGATNIRVTKDGYTTQVMTVNIAGHQTLNITLPLKSPRVDISGTYTLTLVSAPECLAGPQPLPEEARSRTYTALLTQIGPQVSILLSGANFYTAPRSSTTSNRMIGRVNPNEVTFDMSWDPWDDPSPPVAETLATGALLVVNGAAATTVSPGHLSGPLRGAFLVYPPGTVDLSPGRTSSISECNSNNHKFLLSR